MPADPGVTWKTKAVASIISIAVGFIFPLIFFTFNDPDRVKFTAVVIWFSLCLIPASLIVSIKYSATSLLNAIAMLIGVFIGTCVAMIAFYMDRASLFPVVAAIWAIVAMIPVAFGSAIGFLLARMLRRQR